VHVLSIGVDLLPALEAQGFDGEDVVAAVAESCRLGGGDGTIPAEARRQHSSGLAGAQYSWIADALDSTASVICPRSGAVRASPTARSR